VNEFNWVREWGTVFQAEIARQAVVSDIPVSRWLAAGKRTSVNPNGEDRKFWNTHGPEWAKTWADFLEAHPRWEIYKTPDGRAGIELPLEPTFGGVKIKAIPDRVYRTPEGLVVVDLKSGARRPNAAYQLPIYKVALETIFGEPVVASYYFMCRKGELIPDYSPVRATKSVLDEVFALAKRQIELDIYPANPGDNCKRCPVRKHCTVTTG
jgi:hypothetical protein